MSQGLLFIVPGPSSLSKEWPWDYQTMSQAHNSDDYYVPGTVIYCPRSITIAWRMALGLSNSVPGPYFWWSLCPRACYLLSLVHHYCLNNGPGTIKQCPRPIILMIIMSQGHNLLSLVHHYCLNNGPGTIKPCPRSILIIIIMSQGLLSIVPGPLLLPKECPWDYQTVSQVHVFDDQYVPGPVIYCPWSIIIAWRMPWDYQTMSQVHISHDQYVPGPVIYCPWSIIIV